jgi:predicted phosphodiesterase
MKKFLEIVIAMILTSLMTMAEDLRFIQVDNLLYNPDLDNLTPLVKEINSQHGVKFVVFSGNNISKPDKEYLEKFCKEANKLNVPYYVIVGNKDVNKHKGLSKAEYAAILHKCAHAHKKIDSTNYVFEKGKFVFIVVDGAKDVVPSSAGYYRQETLNWLDEQLSTHKTQNVVILQHFPVIPPAQKETYYTFKADEYLKTIKPYTNIKAVISGHFGCDKEQEVNGVLHISTSGAPAYKIIDVTDVETKHPTFWTIVK